MSPDNIKNIMSLILAKNKVTADELKVLKTPEPKDSHYPIPHSMLAEAVRKALRPGEILIKGGADLAHALFNLKEFSYLQ